MADSLKTRQFGRYQLERLLSRGGMGAIYVARMDGIAGFKKQVVIKKILPHLSQNPDFVTRFIDEANIVVTLTHGNIVPVFDMGEVDGQYYIAMEYIAGRDLRDIIGRYDQLGERMPLELAVYVISQTAKALAYAHKKTDENGDPLDLVHRDVSPSNVLVSREGVIKITDFGIAKAVSRLGRSITGRLQGKFAYMSPEQAAGKSVDYRSDVFSLGSVTYELLTGERPFSGESDLAILERVRAGDVIPPRERVPELPAAVEAATLKAMARRPDERFANANDLGRALLACIPADEQAHEPEMAEELSRLFPGAEDGLATAATATGLPLDAVLALEADRMLMASPLGESPTMTAQVEAGPPELGEADTLPAPTPSPRPPAFTPTPRPDAGEASISASWEQVPASRWARWLPLVTSLILVGAAAVVLWGYPGYLRSTSVRVDCDQTQAQVIIDSEYRGRCGGRFEVEPGDHRIQVIHQSFLEAARTVHLVRGEQASVELTLPPIPVPEVEVTVHVDPLDGWYAIGDGEWVPSGTAVTIAAGIYDVRARAEGYQDRTQRRLIFDEQSREHEMVLAALPTPVSDTDGPPGDDSDIEGQQPEDQAVADDGSEDRDQTEDAREPDRPTMVRVLVDSIPSGADLYWNGDPIGRAPDRITVARDAGLQTVRAELTDHEPAEQRFDPRRQRSVTIELQPLVSVTREVRVWPVNPAYAQVYIDGVHRGDTTQIFRVGVGRHTLECVNDEARLSDEKEFEVRPGDEAQRVACFD